MEMNMNRFYSATGALFGLCGLACFSSPRIEPEPRVDTQPSATNERAVSSDSKSNSPVDPKPEIGSQIPQATVYNQLLQSQFAVIFADEDGVRVYDETGSSSLIIDQPFDWLTIDYDTGLMWLDRPWSSTHTPGLYVVDLMAQDVILTKVTRLTRGFEIVGSDGSPLFMTEGDEPYRIDLGSDPISITVAGAGLTCGAECKLSADFLALMRVVAPRNLDEVASMPHVSQLMPPPEPRAKLRAGYSIFLGQLPLSLRLVEGVGGSGDNIGWQLYDNAKEEYFSAVDYSRSSRPLPKVDQVRHLMICEGQNTLVVERGFFTRDLVRLDRGRHWSYGLCLRGGILFADRTGHRFIDP
jgi:hypothetical protein